MTRTIDEIQAELNAAKAEAAEKERALREEKEQAEAERKRVEREAQYRATLESLLAHTRKIADGLSTAGVECKVGEGGITEWHLRTPSLEVGRVSMHFKERYSGATRYTVGTLTGYGITVTTRYADAKHFPPKADGSYNYDAIVTEIKKRSEAVRRGAALAAEREERVREAEALTAKLGGCVHNHAYNAVGRYVETEPTLVLTLDEARALVARLDGEAEQG